jgi:hypothetical protein
MLRQEINAKISTMRAKSRRPRKMKQTIESQHGNECAHRRNDAGQRGKLTRAKTAK